MNVAMQKFTKKSITQTFSDSSFVVGLFGPLFVTSWQVSQLFSEISVSSSCVWYQRFICTVVFGSPLFIQQCTIVYNLVQCITKMYNLVQQCTSQYNSVHLSTILVQQCISQYNSVQFGTIVYNLVQQCTFWYNNVQFGTIVYVLEHCTIVYSGTIVYILWYNSSTCCFYASQVKKCTLQLKFDENYLVITLSLQAYF